MNLLLKILWNLHVHYSHLQIRNYLQKILQVTSLAWLGLELEEDQQPLKAN